MVHSAGAIPAVREDEDYLDNRMPERNARPIRKWMYVTVQHGLSEHQKLVIWHCCNVHFQVLLFMRWALRTFRRCKALELIIAVLGLVVFA